MSSFYYHHARLIEILHCVERIERLLNDPDILSKHVRAVADPNALEGVGVAEALQARYSITTRSTNRA